MQVWGPGFFFCLSQNITSWIKSFNTSSFSASYMMLSCGILMVRRWDVYIFNMLESQLNQKRTTIKYRNAENSAKMCKDIVKRPHIRFFVVSWYDPRQSTYEPAQVEQRWDCPRLLLAWIRCWSQTPRVPNRLFRPHLKMGKIHGKKWRIIGKIKHAQKSQVGNEYRKPFWCAVCDGQNK